MNRKYDLIEDMEYEIENNEEKFEGAKKELGLKLTALENLITEQVDEINVLGENNQSMVSQIAENIQMEKKLNIQKRIFEELQNKLQDDILEENKEVIDERDRLLQEIADIGKENEDKIELLKIIEKEKATLEEKLQKVETENTGLKDCVKKNQKDIPMSDELLLAKEFIIKFRCETWEKTFQTKSELKMHMR